MRIKRPHGLFEIGGNPLSNPGFGGDRQTIGWNQCESSDGVFKFGVIDKAIAEAVAARKQLGVSVNCLSKYPDWLIGAGAKAYTAPQFGTGPMILPFDPIVQPKLIRFTRELCIHLDGLVDYITMGGFGYKTESYMPLPADIGLAETNEDFMASWTVVANLLVDTYAAYLRQTPFILAGGTPFKDPSAQAKLIAIVNRALLAYPLFGVMQWGLNAKSNSGFYINNLITANDTHPGGFQMTGASDGSVGGDLKGTLEECFIAANNMGADFVEVYSADGENPAYRDLLVKYNGIFK
jgi:hypothetical protein